MESGPIPAVHGVVRWRLKDLVQWVWDEFRIALSETTLSRELRALGYRKLSARPRHHARSEPAVAAFKKRFPRVWRTSRQAEADGKPLEIWFADEARVGQKNKITRRWARRGTRPRLRGICAPPPLTSLGRSALLKGKEPAWCCRAARQRRWRCIWPRSRRPWLPAAHAVLLLDQAGWHVSSKLMVPANITLVLLPAQAPELNPVENIWQFMRENWLSNRVFASYTDIVDHCCDAWNKLIDQPWTIMSIGLRDWVNA